MKNTPIALLVVALLCASLAGCTNSIYYYQSDKFGLGVEGKPDATQPVSGTFGFKQRVVAIVPPKDPVKAGEEAPHEEAMSLISYFDFKLKDKPGTMLDPLTVNTALITGRAASELNKTEAQTAFSALASAEAFTQFTETIDWYFDRVREAR